MARPPLPPAWEDAFRRDAESRPAMADPLPERRLARLLAAFLAAGLFFLVAPGTLLGVWNLIGISTRRAAESVPPAWIQAHGHAQLFGWVGSFMIGISLYTVPKFRGAALRSLPTAWAMWGLWTAAVGARWLSGVTGWQWRVVWPAASTAEMAVAVLLLWQCYGPAASGRPAGGSRAPWNRLIFVGQAGLIATMAWQLAAIRPLPAEPVLGAARDRILLWLALWVFTFPVAWGFSARFLPPFLGLRPPDSRAAGAGLALLGVAAVTMLAGLPEAPIPLAGAVAAACWSLELFHPAAGRPKVLGVDPRYPFFVRIAFGWLAVAALLGLAGASRGVTGASRHAFTVGFLATLIFAIGPRILPSFANSRELWSARLMLASLALLTAGCALRVSTEPLAYSGVFAFSWKILPVSALLELAAVIAFALNLGFTLATPFPAWIEPRTITADLPLSWVVTAYPRTRRLLERAGLGSLARARSIPKSLTLRQAALADGADERQLLAALHAWFEKRLARTLREKRRRP
jgi:uncharacterized protein involved in response to NO